MPKSPEELAHQEWIGYVQPIGLVVSIPAMLEAQCYVNKNIMGEHARFLSCLPRDKSNEVIPEIRDLAEFTQKVLGWEESDLITIPKGIPMPAEHSDLEVVLPQYHETLRPTHVVPEFQTPRDQQSSTNNKELATSNYLMLIQELAAGTDLDNPGEPDSSKHWNAAPHAKFERLLRETEIPIGLLSNGRQLRLVYSPRGETSGHATFNVAEMIQVAGRPMFGALHMLLCSDRMFSLGDKQRLPAILENSRKYQNTVSTKLAEQVLAALYELMRGFQAANDVRRGELLRDVLANDPNHVYAGLLRVLMRLVFVMYAEDRDLLSSDPVYSNHYSVTGLFNRLREDAGRFPDTMNQRFGAWSQLITLFRLIYEGGQHNDFKLPPRKGYLFDPDRYPFLEGRIVISDKGLVISKEQLTTNNQSLTTIPRISDGVVFNVLKNLLILDGERLSYRTLDVEQIGSVYETVMGFNLEVAAGKSIAIKPVKSHGAPATINLDALLETKGKDRANWLKQQSDQKLGTADAKQLKEAGTIDELLAALDKKIQKKVTPRVVPAGAIVLQPSDERRRSGSHYTPRSLTEPIVRTTLEPILKQLLVASDQLLEEEKKLTARVQKLKTSNQPLATELRQLQKRLKQAQAAAEKQTPHPAQILELKICDPAMGSGAFLVETCRQLGDELVKSWYAHYKNPSLGPSQGRGAGGEGFPDIPPDEDELLYARRLVAQRCLYGVDKNDMAVDLAKLSLWLVTLAKDHPFTFLDHALRHGDSLVGLTRRQIIGFHWEPKKQKQFGEDLIQRRLDRATEARAKILNAREDVPYRDQEQRLAVADEQLDMVRMIADACVSAFFTGKKKKDREENVDELFGIVTEYVSSLATSNQQLTTTLRSQLAAAAASLRSGEHPIPPFHWEIEFPEVFSRTDSGFDAFVGNPPFLGGARISEVSGMNYFRYLTAFFPPARHQCDLVAYFFRRAFELLRENGAFGLLATKTISQGDTRRGGLASICKSGGLIYRADSRFVWPGLASVILSRIHLRKGPHGGLKLLDGRQVAKVTSFLFHMGGDDDPHQLTGRNKLYSKGCLIYGQGFLFDDNDPSASTIAEMEAVLQARPDYRSRIKPYLGGHDINQSPSHSSSRYAINFSDLDSEEELSQYPELETIIREKVLPYRRSLGSNPNNAPLKRKWWAYQAHRPDLYAAIAEFDDVLVIARVSKTCAFAFVPSDQVFNEKAIVFTFRERGVFAVLQSRVHEIWARFFSSSLKDDLQYTPTACFETFPFPQDVFADPVLDQIGVTYTHDRSELLSQNVIGLTDLYNRFHDPHEKSSEIAQLRELHAAMDRAVLEAYGWNDLAQTARCEFLLDYEEEDDDEPAGKKKSKKKKPWRLRWPDDFRDEVLARLLELNEQRHQEELLAGPGNAGTSEADTPKAKSTKRKKKPSQTKELF
jgi:hypothetical protein